MTAPSLLAATKAYAQLGLLSFGGPAAQIAMMQRMFVLERNWISEKQFMSALSFCMLLPGPEAMQLATYIGWRLHGTIGGIVAGLLFVLPGAIIIYALALLYTVGADQPWINAAFLGVKAAVMIIVIEALFRLTKKALKTRGHYILAGMSFLAIFFAAIPYPAIVFTAGAYGFWTLSTANKGEQVAMTQPISQTVKTIATWLAIWLLPLALIGWITDWGFYFDIGAFFAKLATVTFGGAYAVLAYMAQAAVNDFGWLSTSEMIDGLGLAETTPGPLILVTQFVGYLAGLHQGGIAMGFMAALIVLWMTFAPCFLWIFVGAPYIEWIAAQPRLSGALSAIMAAVVGVVLSLSLWFGLHVLFEQGSDISFGWIQFWLPEFTSPNWVALAIASLCYVLLIVRHWNMVLVLGVAMCLGVLLG